MIEADARVPAKVTAEYVTLDEGQRGMDVVCYENVVRRRGRVELDACTEIGRALLKFTRPLPKGSPAEFRFSLSADGLLSVQAKDMTTAGEVNVEIETAAILRREEVQERKRRSRAIRVT